MTWVAENQLLYEVWQFSPKPGPTLAGFEDVTPAKSGHRRLKLGTFLLKMTITKTTKINQNIS